MTAATVAIETSGLGKRYGGNWAVQDCTFSLTKGRIAALVGPNGAGKSTLLRMLAGVTVPSVGDVWISGRSPADPEGLSRIGYLDQERPLYNDFSVAEMLRFGREFNPRWDDAKARDYLADFDISLRARVGKLSGGQRAQVALTMCLAKCPDLLLLDEPAGSLDPLARENLMHVLLRTVADYGTTVMLSSHAIADLVNICDYVLLIEDSRIQVADDLDRVLAEHRVLIGSNDGISVAPEGMAVISAATTSRETTMLVRSDNLPEVPGWEVHDPSLEEIVLAYLRKRPQPTIDFGTSPRLSVRASKPRSAS
jgi:ABC-2 type transport system ATP-binding protein